jgi:hypothetical protein
VPLHKIYRSLRSVFLIFLVFCVLLLCVFTLWVPCCDFRIQTIVGSFFTSSCFLEGSCLINVICVCLRIMVSNAHCVRFLLVFVWFLFFVLCDMRCQFLWIVHFVLPLQYSLSFIDISTLNVR